MNELTQHVLEKTACLFDEPVFIDSNDGRDITTLEERQAYESGLVAMREAMIPLVHAAVTEAIEICCKAVCGGCRRGIPIRYENISAGPGLPKTWVHVWGSRLRTRCKAAKIRGVPPMVIPK